MIKAVIFDFDGVIINSEPIHEEAWRSFLLKHNIIFTEDMRIDFKGRTATDNLRNVLGISITDEQIKYMVEEKQAMYRSLAKSRLTLVDGVENFLKHLHDTGMPIALATSSLHRNLEFAFDKFRIKEYFSVIVTTEEIKNNKPDPEIFLTAAKKLQVEPSECIVFEDAPSGVLAAKRAGMKVVFVETSLTAADVGHINASIRNFSNLTIGSLAEAWA